MKDPLRSNPKLFYFVNSKRRSNGVPKSLKFGSTVANSENDFFATTYSKLNYTHDEYPHTSIYFNIKFSDCSKEFKVVEDIIYTWSRRNS